MEGRAVYLIGLVESVDHVCCRYRLRAFRDALATAGHTVEFMPLSEGWGQRMRALTQIGRADAVILQRKLLPIWQVGMIRRRARRLIYDFDDAVFLRDSYADEVRSPRRQRRFAATVRAADAVVAGNVARHPGSGRGRGRVDPRHPELRRSRPIHASHARR
jgi:hypothetical protein